jgi:hypothetical protein
MNFRKRIRPQKSAQTGKKESCLKQIQELTCIGLLTSYNRLAVLKANIVLNPKVNADNDDDDDNNIDDDDDGTLF